MKISVIMASALVLLVLPGYAFAAPSIVTSLTASVEDGAGGFEELEGPKGVTAVTVGSSTYALVAAYDDDGVQIINITDPNNPTPVASIGDGEDGFEELKGARYVTTVTIDSSTYALVSASADHGVQIINITTPSSPSPVAHVSNAAGLALQDPRGIATLTTGSSTYALVATHKGFVQIVNITTPSSPAPVANVRDGSGGFEALSRARGITTVTLDSSTYALIASYDDGVQIINVTNPSEPAPVAAVLNSQSNRLDGATGITTVTVGSSTYALVAAQNDNAVQIINITDPSSPESVAFAQDGSAGFDRLRYPESIATVTFGSSTYAVVASFLDGIQIINITDPSNPSPAASVGSFDTRFGNFALPEAITAVTIDSKTYVLVASYFSNSVPIIGVDLTLGPVLTSATFDEGTGILETVFSDTVDVTPSHLIDLSKMTVGDFGQSVSLTGAALMTETDSAVLSIELTEDQGRSVATMASPRLDISGSAVTDTSGNPIDSTSDNIIAITDDVAPEVVSVTLNEETGILEITFSDRVDVTPAFMVYPGGMTVSDSGQSVSLAGATLRTEADSAVISIELTGGQRQSVAALASPMLSIDHYSIVDTEGNPIESSSGNAVAISNASEILTVTSIERSDPAVETTSAQTLVFEVTFSEDVTGVNLSDFALSSGGTGTGSVTNLTGSGSQYLVSVSAAQDGTYNLDIVPNNGITDMASNPLGGTDPTGEDQPYTVRTSAIQNATTNTPPSINAGPDQTVQEGSTVTLNGTTSDQDGDQLTYSWSHDSALDISLANADSLSPAFTAPQVSADTTVTFTLTVSDGTNDGVTDQVEITVTNNDPPTVNAGADQAVDEGDTVTLTGTATDDDDDPLTYRWTHDSSLAITMANDTSLSTTFTVPAATADTTVTFTLTVSDGTNDGVTDQVEITVTNNDPPTVNAGADQAVDEGDTVTLTGTATDDDDDPLTYRWTHDSSLAITMANDTSLSTTFTAPAATADTTVTFTLTVSDGTNDGVTDQVEITVTNNDPPTVNAGADQAVDEGDTVTLTGTATDDDDDPLTYRWTHDSSLAITMANDTSLSTTFTAPAATADTTVTFTLTADDGTDTHSDTVTVTILDVPVVGTPNGGSDQNTTAVLNPDGPLGPRDIGRITLTSAQPGTIQASWEAPSETPVDYRISWAKAGEPYLTWTDLSGNAFPTDPSRTIADLEESETYKVKVRARYGGSAGDWSGEITITVARSANNPPTTDAGTAQAVQEGDAVTLSGTASDQDDDQLAYSWSHDSALDISLANADSLSPAFTAPQVSANTTVTFTLTADDGTDTHSDTVTVTILDVPVVGTPNGGSDQNTTAVLNPDGPLGPHDIGRITLTSAQPGTIQASWEAPSETPVDYRISWAKAGEPYLTWTDLSGNAFPTDPSRTIADLEESETYKVKVRARYGGSAGDWSGEITITVARTG